MKAFMNHNQSLIKRIFIYAFVSLPLTAFLIMGVYVYSEKMAIANYLELSKEELKLANQYYENFKETIYSDVELITLNLSSKEGFESIANYKDSTVEIKTKSATIGGIETEIYEVFKNYGMTHSESAYVYLATKDGGIVTWPETEIPAGFDPRNRSWYQQTLLSPNQVISTQPYIDGVTSQMVVSHLRTLTTLNGEISGVVGIDVTNEKLVNVLNGIRINGVGYCMLVSDTGLILSDSLHPENQYKTMKEIGFGDIVFGSDRQSQFQVLNVDNQTLGGEKLYFNFMATEDNAFYICTVVSQKNISNAVKAEGKVLIFFIGLAFSALLILIISGIYLLYKNKILGRKIVEQEAEYHSLVDNIPGVVFRCQPVYPWRMIHISRECENMTGYKMEEIELNGNLSWVDLIHEDDREMVKLLDQGKSLFYQMEYRIRKKNGEYIWVYERGTHVYDAQGSSLYIDGLIFDINARKNIEIELEGIRKDLEERVETRTLELKKALTLMNEQEKMASLGAIVSGVAHEINTPLGIGVTMASHLDRLLKENKKAFESGQLSKGKFKQFIEESKEGLNILESNLSRAASLISSFKQIAVDQNVELESYFKVKEYVEMILLSLRHEYKNKGHQFRVDCDDHLMIHTYPGAFSQILTNLIMNSIIHGFKDREKGMVHIGIERRTIDDKNSLILLYEDNGVGIAADVIVKIFEPFFTTNRQNGGSGLGLNIIYNLVTQKLNGSINCTSEMGQYTRFNIEFPIER